MAETTVLCSMCQMAALYKRDDCPVVSCDGRLERLVVNAERILRCDSPNSHRFRRDPASVVTGG